MNNAPWLFAELTLADATSFVVMEPLKIPSALTFDNHFAQYSFSVLAPDHP